MTDAKLPPPEPSDHPVDVGSFVRVQCKTGRYRNGSVRFNPRSTRTNGQGVHTRRYDGEAELFLVFCPANDRIHAVPVEGAPIGEMALRLEPSQNGQSSRVNLASEYELPG